MSSPWASPFPKRGKSVPSSLVPLVPPFVPAVSSSARFSAAVPTAHATHANPEAPEAGAM